MANLRLYGVMMRCVGLKDDKHNNKEEEQADAKLEQELEGEGGVDYTEHPLGDNKDVPVTLVVALGNLDAMEFIARCGTDEKEK